MDRITKASFIIFFIFLLCIGWFNLATPFLTVLFSYFALSRFRLLGRRWLSIALFLVLVLALSYGFVFLVKHAVATLPRIATESIPVVLEHAKKYHIELPVSDIEDFRNFALDEVRDQLGHLAKFAQIGLHEIAFFLLGLVIAISLFGSRVFDLGSGKYAIKSNLYSEMGDELAARFIHFYKSFATVMGAQLVISIINTFFTSMFVLIFHVPFAKTVIVITFICGLFPIVGNVLSNMFIFGVAITKSLKLAIFSLIFLVVLHKFEYFLNSKIVGQRIKNPVWLTLFGLIIGEKLLGLAGMILAPVILHYLKLEGTEIEVKRHKLVTDQ